MNKYVEHISFSVPCSDELLETGPTVYDGLDQYQKFVCDQFEKDLLSVFTPGPAKPKPIPTKRERFKRWLGYKLFCWALKIDPDLADEYY